MRLTDRVNEKVVEAIGQLPILQAERDQIDHEIVVLVKKGLTGEPQTMFGVSLFVPIPNTKDQVGPADVLEDAYCSQGEVNSMIRKLYADAHQQIDRMLMQRSPAFGKRSASGLIVSP